MSFRPLLPQCLVLLACAACNIAGTDFTGRACQSAADCPEGLTCAQVPGGVGRVCERVRDPIFSSGGLDGGVAYYCSNAKPVLDGYCISCHSDPPSAGAPRGFRLDVYATDGGPLGASAVATLVANRAYVLRDMPPPGLLAPSTGERITLAAWAASGALYCADAGF